MKLYPSNPVLIIDDEVHILEGQKSVLMSEGISNVICTSDSRSVKEILANQSIEAVLLDLIMPFISGQEILKHIVEHYPQIPVIVITGTNDISEAVTCMKTGAFDYMVKAVEKSRLISGVKRAIEYRQLQRENRKLRRCFHKSQLKKPEVFSEIITKNVKMQHLFSYIELIAESVEPVLITGETGVGKELLARAIHSAGNYSGDFVAVNVAGLDDLAFSDTLFGHKKGAFTGASESRHGLLQKAEGGTILLDEIGDLSRESQVKLLRLIDRNDYYTLGSDILRKSEARIIAVTNRNIGELVENGAFRRDLFYRLDTHSLSVPPLRERLEDLPLLVNHFLEDNNRSDIDGLLPLLQAYSFPGNVRELRSLIIDSERRSSQGEDLLEIIRTKLDSSLNLPFNAGTDNENISLVFSGLHLLPTIKEAGEALVLEALRRTHGNQSSAAGLLGISKQALNKRITNSHNRS
ncbi:MAG: sigma-54-dependent Fis family transcriptional regulator [Spirochaetales bacterium]|nr:sigma-54-dependent Fis family transcriptional regulator [Spirochaetales bacterium]